MDKTEFLSELKLNLANLPIDEIESAISYYREYFDDAGKENEANIIKKLGTPAEVASQIIANYAVNDNRKSAIKGMSNIKLIIQAIFSSSIALPIAILMAFITLILVILSISVIISIAITVAAFIIGGVILILNGFISIFNNISTTILLIGIGSSLFGIGLILFSAFIGFTKCSFSWIAKFIGKILLRSGDKNVQQQ